MTISNDLLGLIREKQRKDLSLQKTMELLGTSQAMDFAMGTDGIMRFRDKICLPNNQG